MRFDLVATWSFICLAAPCYLANLAEAKTARCSTTDDGTYSCEFHATAGDGSFEISAPGKPTYILNMVEPGVAYGFVNLGQQNTPLPGRFLRSATDPACWLNDSTGVEVCAH